jgi:hypothetical protein
MISARARWLSIPTAFVAAMQFGAPLPAQQPRTWRPPNQPTPTLRLPASLPHTGHRVISLRGELLASHATIGRPTLLLVQGNSLWLNDEMGDPSLHEVDWVSGNLVRSVGRRGEGPGDFRNVAHLSLRPGDREAVWAFDMVLRRLTRVGRQSVRPDAPRTIGGLPRGQALRMFWLTTDRIAVIGTSDSNRILLTDTTGNVLSVIPGPLVGATNVSRPIREAASTGVLVCANPRGTRIAVAYALASRIDLFDPAGRFVGKADTPIATGADGDFFKDGEGRWHMPAPRYYYRGCSATSERLYALFAGRLDSAGPEGTRMWDAQFVHVFDWAGKLIHVLDLNEFAEGIAVVGDSLLFAAGEAMDGIYKYRIP